MGQLVTSQTRGHWYDRQGKPCHTLPKKDGTGDKSVTVREARELALAPSVTTILGLMAKPWLESWKQEQAILSALTLPRQADEALDEFAKRVVNDMQEQSRSAIQRGIDYHAAVEAFVARGEKTISDEPLYKYLSDCALEGKPEWTFWTDKIGFPYGGCVDFWGKMRGESVVIDFKTQATQPDKPIRTYDDWAYQLAAYSYALPIDDTRKAVNIVVSSTEPGRYEAREWSSQELAKAGTIFKLLGEMFYLVKELR